MGQARFGAASEVGFAKAEYDEFGNRTMSSNQKMGLAGTGVAAFGASQISRANRLPVTTAEALQRNVDARRQAQKDMKRAQQERLKAGNPSRLNVVGQRRVRRAKREVTQANARLAGAKTSEGIIRNFQANLPQHQKVIRRAGWGGVVAGGGLAALAARRGLRNMDQQAGMQ